LRQYLNIGFVSGLEKTEMIQTGGGASYQFRLEKGWLNSAENQRLPRRHSQP
jgi:hypothetical protein